MPTDRSWVLLPAAALKGKARGGGLEDPTLIKHIDERYPGLPNSRP